MKRPPGISSKLLVDGSASWRYRFKHGKEPDGRDKYVSQAGFSTMREAVEEMTRQKAHLGKASRLAVGDVSFGQFFLEWLDYAGAKWTPKTREVNAYQAERAMLRFGQIPLSKITTELLEQEQRHLLMHGKKTKHGTAPLSAKSVKETFTLVKAALRQAKKWNRISIDPGADIEVPTIKRRHKEVLQEEQLQRFLESISGTRDYALVVFAAASGCRRGEMLALQINDINLTTGEVKITKSLEQTKSGLRVKPTKSEKPRSLTLPTWALPILREHLIMISQEKDRLGNSYQQNDLLFPQRDGSYHHPDKIGGHINYLLKQHGLQSTLHGLRHFHASWMLSNRVPLPIVSQRLGHANPAITLAIYSHVMKADDAAAAATLHAGLEMMIPSKKTLRPVLVPRSDTANPKTGTKG